MLRALQWEKGGGVLARLRARARVALRPVAMTAMMFLMMRAELMLRASPMAAALMAAGLAAGESPAALVAGCLLGMLRLPLREAAVLPAVSCAAVMGVELLLPLLLRARSWARETRASMTAGLAVLLPALLYAGGAPLPSLQAFACAVLSAAASPFLFAALSLRPGRTRLLPEERAGLALLACAGLAGVQCVLPPLAEALAVLGVLMFSGGGAAVGALAGLALAVEGGNLLKLASLSLCAWAAGAKFCARRWQRALALCVAAALAQWIAGVNALGAQWALCAAAVYLLLPERLVRRAERVAAPSRDEICPAERVAREVTADARRRLRALGDVFEEMADACAAPTDVPDEQALICEMRSRLCGGCAGYEACWAGGENRGARLLCRLIGEALDRVDAPPGMRVLYSDGEIPPDVLRACRRGRMIPDRLGLLMRDFAEKRRAEIKRCATGQRMSVQYMQAREILYNLAERQSAPVSYRSARLDVLRAALEAGGIGDCEVFACGAEEAEIFLSRPDAPWTREEARRAGAALARVLGGRFELQLRGETLRFAQRPRYRMETGASCQSGVAGEACGDSHLVRMLGSARLALMLSDGMGLGESAAQESRETLRLLWRFLEAGVSMALALETVNRQMLDRSAEDMFATVDLCVVDLNTGVAELTKLAACRTLILRGRELLRVEGGRLPLGILEGVRPSVTRVRLRPGDLLVMGSDGVMEAGDALMIERLVRTGAQKPPEQMAGELVREAGLRRAGERRDDLTCICARLWDEKRSRNAATG